jgi:hypothetical protein
MIFRYRQLDQKLKIDRRRFVDCLNRVLSNVGFSLLLVFTAFCNPKSSGLAEFAEIPTALVSATPIFPTPETHVPVLAFYYIWFDSQSWDRAKTDYPLLGRYSSDDADVMRKHVEWAKEAGIDGFIVSWKSTEKLNTRLEQLVQVAEQENFKLAIMYESLDFERNPLPITQVDADLGYFITQYANHPAFDLFQKPLVIWSGTWEYSTQEIASVVQDKRDQIHILASEKNVKEYQRLSGLVDGDAYYWSSVDPDTHPGYLEKLAAMSDAVHQDGGLWVAPAAPGFDARLVGGEKVVSRESGDTLQKELATAVQSSPDAVGLISWNEFSENSHIEPSQVYGYRYLEILAEMLPVAPYSR